MVKKGPSDRKQIITMKKLECNECGGVMRIDTGGVYIYGGGPSPIVKLRCDNCDITRFEKREDIDAELADKLDTSEKKW